MLTIFGVPKAFRGHSAIIQRNAIQSWTHLVPQCEVILIGDDDGAAAIAAELDLRHHPKIDRNKYGTPLLNSAFKAAEEAAKYPHLCYVNSDIILMSDFLPAVAQVLAQKCCFLLVGRRWDLEVNEPLKFDDGWEKRLKDRVRAEGKLREHTAIDYFIFPRGLWQEIPPFAIGRVRWDNWLIYQASSQGVPVIDLTERVTVVHQNHAYANPGGLQGIVKSPEGQRNQALLGGYAHGYTVWDAKYKLTNEGLKKRRTLYFFYRQLVTFTDQHPYMLPVLKLVRAGIEAVRTGRRLLGSSWTHS